MATTTFGNTGITTRRSSGLYWTLAVAILILLVAFFATRSTDTRMSPVTEEVPVTESSMITSPTTSPTTNPGNETGTPSDTDTGTNRGTNNNGGPATGTDRR